MNNITVSSKTTHKALTSKEETKPVNQTLEKSLLACGFLSSVLYLANNIITIFFYKGYNAMSQTVSELSAIGAPTRSLWISLNTFYTALVIAFGLGIWYSAGPLRSLRILSVMMISYVIFCLSWPPMHKREILAAGGGTLTDTLHIVWTFVTVILMLCIIGLASKLFGKGFRIYSMITIVILLGFGSLTGLAAPQMEANLPTPWMGVWERICIGAYMLWIMVLALMLFRKQKITHTIPY